MEEVSVSCTTVGLESARARGRLCQTFAHQLLLFCERRLRFINVLVNLQVETFDFQ